MNPLPNLKRVFSVPQIDKELEKLFGKSKKDLYDFIEYMLAQFQILEWADRRLDKKPFEHLRNCNADLYRLRSPSNSKNVRILYYYREDETIVLLCAFEERSNVDYQNNIKFAISRIKEIERNLPL